ncbi:MAG: type III pantothenate kinase [Nitrospinae bacterium]|nr:type III pantothenate kinase [Nitrospinota bacterium]
MKSHLLAIDIGNTNIVIGVYSGEKLVAHWRMITKGRRTEDEMAVTVGQFFAMGGLSMDMIKDAAISCVVPPILPAITRFCERFIGRDPLVIGPGIKTGVSINVDNPREVGADRIANAAGALVKYVPPLIIVDFGTAITVDAVSAKSEYIGGAIVPGVRLSLNALYHHAAKLPEVEFAEPPSVIGRNTIHSMQSGAFFGYASLVDGIVERMKPQLSPNAKVIATGGEAALVAPASKTIEAVEEHLTLEGLRAIYAKNRE